MAKILKIKQPPKRRRRNNEIPLPERQKRQVESVRILPWARQELSYAATKRQEPRTTFEGKLLEGAAHVIANVRAQAETFGIANQPGFEVCLSFNFLITLDGQTIHIGGSEHTIPDSKQKELMKIEKELGKFYNPFFMAKLIQKHNQELGCSIAEAIENGMDGAAWRAVKQLMRDARSYIKHNRRD